MDYIRLHKRFWSQHKESAFAPADTHLYWCLVDQFNGKGQKGVWPETINFTDGALSLAAGINVKTMDSARKRLLERSLIEVARFGQGARSGATYKLTGCDSTSPITSPTTSVKIGDVIGEVNGEVASTSVKIGEVSGEVEGELLQQPLPQHTQQPLQFLRRFLYIEYQTPNNQTPNFSKTVFVADRDDVRVRKLIQDRLNLKKKKKPPRLRPAPPNIPFSVWYDTYDKKRDPVECEVEWIKLTDDERQAALTHTGRYADLTPKQYRKDPIRYLKKKSWHDEIIERHEPENTQPNRNGYAKSIPPANQTAEQRTGFLSDVFAAIDSVVGKQ